MRNFLLLGAIFIFNLPARSQPGVDSVKATVNSMFTAMKTCDAELLKASFADSAILQTIEKDKSGKVKIKTEEVKEFAEFLRTQERGSLDEQIVFDVVKVDDDLAIAWTPYKFYYKGKFSHCGVNSFQLVRINNIWKIQYLVDTRRRTGCE
jgi:hypothetical protein